VIRGTGTVLWATDSELVVDVPGWPSHRPGQFAMINLDPGGVHLDPLLPRPMSIFRADGERVEFRFKVVGRGTQLLSELVEGTRIGVLGPLGNGYREPEGRAVLVGGGTGIASLYGLAGQCSADARVLLGGQTRRDVLALEEFRALPVELKVATDDGSCGHHGVVTELLELDVGDEVFACGPAPMMRVVSERAREADLRCWVSLESNMACGFGICLGCVVETHGGFRYVCTDGPVFDARSIDWERLD
jgi:dihydroorotate dehydrogenase electron transfer subunit